ncbi:Phage integrase family protein [Roseovarius nanhaiticus]|uniref:Phage integrase family protein n=1 Tax=Roseovarius nanhaiticus TaxID=573024 RepID=A0A1N7FGQ2_9RHOB|nr:site-specific integrase [Roseovarius nanhaiticus]SEK54941.1 Phage integrase family protein [Roseovarius nanhaiticus]SIR99464.1 Phage integrase family protein [Roseovarius nanhaiticus]
MKQHVLRQTDIESAIKNFTKKCSMSDGAGLILLINSATSQSWVYRYKVGGLEKRLGLGSYPHVNLSQARKLAQRERGKRAEGLDPAREKVMRKRRGVTFEEAAREYWQTHCQSMAKPSNWIAGMEKHMFPRVGTRVVADVLPEHLITAFKPIWGREMSRKLAQWVNAVIVFVSVDDPRVDTQLMDKVKNRLGPQKIEYEHHAAVPWQKVPDLWQALPDTLVGNSMKLLLLSAVRVNCVSQARWDEFDFKEKVWTIPAGRVKGWKVPFRVPLTRPMIEVLRRSRRFAVQTDFVFESPDSKSLHLSNNAHRLWLHKHKWTDADGNLATAHGLRSSFKDWSDDAGQVDMMLSEHCLQHVKAKGDQTARAYFRTDQLERRREVMEAWSEYAVSGEVQSRKNEEERKRLDETVDVDGRTLREVLKWSHDPDEPLHDDSNMTAEEAAEWARYD